MHVRTICIVSFLLFSAHFSIFSQGFLHGNELSDTTSTALAKKGFTPIKQELSQTGQDDFADNLILSFPATSDGKKEVAFCFTQEDFALHEDAIIDFLSFLKDEKHDWTATVLFSALDRLEFKANKSIKGTQVFAESVDDTDAFAAIAVTLDSSRETAIHTGSKRHTTPLWLTKQISDAFYDSQVTFSFEDLLSAIYRLGIVSGKERLSFFFMNDIPAIEVNFSSDSELSVLKTFARNYSSEGSDEWDMHYIYIKSASFFRPFFINEKTILISCLSVGILTILILCVFSFVGVHGERHKYEFIRSSYMIPFTLGISFLSLFLGQAFVSQLSIILPLNPILQYGIKIVFSMIFISALFTVQGILKFSVTAFMYGYLLSVVAIFNIFLFSTRDLTLFVIFISEYIIIYLSRTAKRLFSLSLFFILMLLPFLPYSYIIIKSAEDLELTRTVFTDAIGNLLLSFAIFPFQITWLRMLVLLNVRAGIKGYTMKKMILNGVFSTIAILLFIFAVIFSISHFIYRPSLRAANKSEIQLVNEDKASLSAKLTSDEFSGMNTNHIKITSKEEALHYEVFLQGIETIHPVYDSIYDYEISSDKDGNEIYTFIIPDYPPKSITIDYAADSKARAKINITAYYKKDEPHTFRIEKRELKVE
ncbi:hypothetical protein [uncultured Treponema sp.]|uniref:hypothetical protein n=1 Tax=uncultured Treponema sp. TaxID=162155 RepID=UPI0025FCFE39|nr:hypothetical protein [uncultured Treponema sp.]